MSDYRYDLLKDDSPGPEAAEPGPGESQLDAVMAVSGVGDIITRRQQGAEILSEETAERQLVAQHLLETVCSFYGVTLEEMQEERTVDRFIRPRRIASHLLRQKLGLSVQEVAIHLQREKRSLMYVERNFQKELEQNSLLAAEVAYLSEAEEVTHPLNERIIQRVAEATGLEPEAAFAKRMIMALMAERGHLPLEDIAKRFDVSRNIVRQAQSFIAYEQLPGRPRQQLLKQQLDWIRQQIFTEEPARFTFNPDARHELREGQEVLLRDRLPETVKKIYGILDRASTFYGIPLDETITHSNNFLTSRTRRAAALLCHQAEASMTEIAVCLGIRETYYGLGKMIETALLQQQEDKIFAEEIKALSRGEERRDVLAETFEIARDYYGLSESEMRLEEGHWPERARAAFVATMARHAYTTHEHIGTAIGRPDRIVSDIVARTKKRLEHDPRFLAEIAYIADPSEAPRPPDVNDILDKIHSSTGISLESLHRPHSAKERRIKRLTAFILIDELALPREELAKILQVKPRSIESYKKLTKQELAKHPERIWEIDQLRPAGAISLSRTGQVLMFVAKRCNVPPENLSNHADAPNADKFRALDLAVNLLLGDGQSVEYVAQLLNMPSRKVQSLIRPPLRPQATSPEAGSAQVA